jgi:hypothetical protein
MIGIPKERCFPRGCLCPIPKEEVEAESNRSATGRLGERLPQAKWGRARNSSRRSRYAPTEKNQTAKSTTASLWPPGIARVRVGSPGMIGRKLTRHYRARPTAAGTGPTPYRSAVVIPSGSP